MDSAVTPTLAAGSGRPAAARDRLMVALDFPNQSLAIDLVDRLENRCSWVKVGLELFLATGPGIVEALRRRGYNVFVDLKLHDIPNTVAGAVSSLSSAGADLLTIHASGGRAMISAAVQAARVAQNAPKVIAVTVLTSLDAALLSEVGVVDSPSGQALRLARVANEAGCDGMVCSPHEASLLRTTLGPDSLLVVPGIRPSGSGQDDQNRTATPGAAISAGASFLVVGRPITKAADPAAATDAILAEIALAL